MSTGRLHQRKAVVTGAAQGLGEALAHRLASEGCYAVVVSDINEERAQLVASAIAAKHGCKTLALRTDVTSEQDVCALMEATNSSLGGPDILVSNAGILIAHDIADFPAEDWKRVLDVNLYGYFLCARYAAKYMIASGGGSIIQINSKSGKKGSFRNSAYAASKFGGIGLTQSLALDLAPHNVRVNAVCPGNLLDGSLWQESLYQQYARTQAISVDEVRAKYEAQVPLGRGCTYEDVANVVTFLASSEASYMTGQAINVTGGQEMR